MADKDEQKKYTKKEMKGFLIEIQRNINYYINYYNDKNKNIPIWSSIENEKEYGLYMINKQLEMIKDSYGEDEVYKQIDELKINYRLKP